MSIRLPLACALIGLAPGLLTAAVLPEAISGRLDANAEAFVQGQGFKQVEPDTLTGSKYYSKAVFPASNSASMSAPDADLDPVTKAVLLLESQEKPLSRVRYRVTYNVDYVATMPEIQQSYLEVTRFNLGPTIRNDLMGSIPKEHLGSAESFGVGPHVSWRFAMAPRMGMRADVVSASRKVLTSSQAGALDCLGVPCLSLADPEGPAGKWRKATQPSTPKPVFAHKSKELDRPARVAQQLIALAAGDGLEAAPYRPDSPRMVFVVSLNVSGQEELIHGLVHDTVVMDDSIASIWTQRMQISGVPVEYSQLFVPRRR